MKGKNTPAIAAVVYGNRAYDDALLELTDILTDNGFVVIGAAAFVARHSIFPEVARGRPDTADKEILRNFARQCGNRLETIASQGHITVKGSRPYREAPPLPLKPSGNSRCNSCGACVKICPVGAITAEEPRKTDKAACITCTACIYVCPQKARSFRGLTYKLAGGAFRKKCSSRKEPELFA
uniref:4Fe-4S binding protein n=2 Tax=Breznakiella homolactica TaxID=2798577 RepID=A0A7T8BB54_9SPIR